MPAVDASAGGHDTARRRRLIDKVGTVKVELRKDACQGHGRCHALAPEVFSLDDDGYLEWNGPTEITPADERAARRGVTGCPERALSVTN
ncbi:ferredoxin [Sporichthya polymorpha]|uniref:ferredoxin n=1 Tax=Sporichthya polymorpha TaxID=35751 RepID=UPI0012EC1DEF|nr:ferredoxin [Sporichthya polymorpha]